MAKTFKDFQERVAAILQDAGKALSLDNRDDCIRQAIEQRYSKDRAREIVSDSAGDGTSDIDLPGIEGSAFEEGFSRILEIEFPIGQVPPVLLEDGDWQYYRTPAGKKVRFLSTQPAVDQSIRFTWTVRHKADGTTVLSDFDAVCDYSASLAFAMIAAKFAQTGDATIGADSVNYRTKSQEYMGLSKAAAQRYFDHMGIASGSAQAAGGVSAGPALSIGDSDNVMGWGGDRLTHGRRTR